MADLSSVKMIVFDVDGTLAETDDYFVEKTVVLTRKILPFISPEKTEKIIRPVIMAGETALHSVYRLMDMIGLDKVISVIHNRFSVKKDYVYKAVAGMQETVRLLSGHYILGIITSGGRKSTDAFLKKYELENYVKYVISAEDCTYIKPHPAPLRKIAEDAGVPVNNCMLVGDTIFDVICAKRAGAVSAAVKSGFDTEFLLRQHKADLYLNTVSDLPAALGVN